MKKDDLQVKTKKGMFEGRAVMTGVVAVTAFLCLFTAFEIFSIKMEWNVPVLQAFIGGADNYIFSHYREEEEKLELSTENVVWEEVQLEQNMSGNPAAEPEEITTTETHENTEAGESSAATEMAGNIGLDEGTVITEQFEGEEELAETEQEEFPYYIRVNRQQNVVTVYKMDDGGNYSIPIKAFICSTGAYNATPEGVFHISTKYIWRELNGGVYGQYASRITGGVLFHSVPYVSKNKGTLYWEKYNKLGQQTSMGCVRLTVADAKWIYDNCPSGTAVEVYDSEDPGPLGKPTAVKLDRDDAYKNWDPTDPDENNPWHQWSEDE